MKMDFTGLVAVSSLVVVGVLTSLKMIFGGK